MNIIKNIFDSVVSELTAKEILKILRTIVRPLSMVTGAGSNRLSVDVNSVTTVAAVTNQVNIGGVSAFEQQKNLSHIAWATRMRPLL